MSIAGNYKIIRKFKNKTAAEIRAATGISKQNLSTWENDHSNPGPEFIDLLAKFFDLPKELFYRDGLTKEYMENHYSGKNITPVQERSDNKENEMVTRGEVYRDIVEGNTEYVLVLRSVLQDAQIISNVQLASSMKNMDAIVKKMDEDSQIMKIIVTKFVDTVEKVILRSQPVQTQKGKHHR
jgi:transcriptional regulator with XRE-family HTH domain